MEASISPNDLFSTHHHLMWLLVRNNFSGKISSKESLLDTGKKNIGSCYLDAGAQPPCLLDFTEKCGCGITSGTSMQEDQPVE